MQVLTVSSMGGTFCWPTNEVISGGVNDYIHTNPETKTQDAM